MTVTQRIAATLLLAFLITTPGFAATPPPDLPPCPSAEQEPDIAALIRRVEYSQEGLSSIATIRMNIQTETWSRSLRMRIWSKGRDYALIRILEGGPREIGMMTLKREKQLWNYLPQAERVMRLPSGMMGDSWMGSDFTNDDLVGGTSMVDDFTYELVGTLTHDDREAWHIRLTPKASATMVWERIEIVVDRETCVPLVQRFYDDDGEVARTMTFSDIRTIGWRHFPGRISVKPEDTERETVIVYESIEFDVDIPDATFSLHRLQQGR